MVFLHELVRAWYNGKVRSAPDHYAPRPIGGIAMTLLCLFLNVHPPQKRPLRDQIAELDFIGLFSLVGGVVCLLIGLNFSEESC